MPLRNYTEDLEYSESHGCDTTSPLPMIPAGFVANCLNGNVEKTGGYSKRMGYTFQLGTAWAGQNIRYGIEFKTSSTANSQIVFASDSKIGYVNGTSVTDLSGITFSSNRMDIVQFSKFLYFYNGNNAPMLWDGGSVISPASVRQIGITAPTAALTATQGTGGQLVAQAEYIWTYTFANYDISGNLLAESSPAPLFQLLLTSSNTKVTLTIPVTTQTPSTATAINLYRTVANGSVLFFDTRISISASSYTDGNADATLTYAMELDNSRIVQLVNTGLSPKYPAVVRNRVFLKTNDNEVRFSKLGQFGPLPESFEVKSVTTTNGRFGNTDYIVGLNSINGIPIVLKRKTIGRLEEQGLPDNTQSFDLVGYTYRELAESYGAVSHYAAISVYNELIYLGFNNIYATDGMNIRAIAHPIEATIKALNFETSTIDFVSCVNDEQYKRIYFAVYTSTGSTPAFILVGDYDKYPEFKWTFYGAGVDAAQWPAPQVGSFFKIINADTGIPETYFGNAASNGQYYKMNTGDADVVDSLHEYGIYFQLTTRPYSMKEPMIKKLFERARVFVQGGFQTYNLTVSAIYDLGIANENAQLYPIGGIGGTWDDYNWGDMNPANDNNFTLIWASQDQSEIIYCGHHRAKFQQLVFTQTDADAPVTILGWGTSAAMQAPR